MSKEVLYLGLDVHAESIAVAIAEAGRDGEVRNYGEIPNTFHSVDKLMRKLGQPDKELRVCYEAGPCGFVLARFLKKKGIACDVIAPSLTPKGCNAIEYAARLICRIRDMADQFKEQGPYDEFFDVPFTTMTTNQIQGGIAVNTIPDLCEFAYEFRNLPGMSVEGIQAQVGYAYGRM